MATYLICYDLNREGAGYSEANKRLIEQIRARFPTYWHHLDSTWVVVTDKTPAQVRDELTPFIDKNDELLVVRSGGVGAWAGFNQRGSEWLKEHL